MPQQSEILRSSIVEPLNGPEREISDRFGAQIGELAWHLTHVDDALNSISERHADRICSLARDFNLLNPLILEVGAYAHHSSFLAASQLNGTAWAHDISPDSLRLGQTFARARNLCTSLHSIAGDFHDLPFEDNMFDIVFVASAVHHTWQPWRVIAELGRVTRPGGIIHLENEPVARMACLYSFRGNRPSERTLFENKIDQLGLTHTVTSPFPGSRAESLFNIIENDRIPLGIYETALRSIGDIRHLELESGALIGQFENWLLHDHPQANEIASYLIERITTASKHLSSDDAACGITVPTPDAIWPLAYRLADAVKACNPEDKQTLARLFGAALQATTIKRGDAARKIGYRRELSCEGTVLIDDEAARGVGLSLINVAPAPVSGNFGEDWLPVLETGGHHSLCNLRSDCQLRFYQVTGALVLRIFSVHTGQDYFLSVISNGKLRFRHHVARSESYLALIFVSPGDQLSVHMHMEDGSPFDFPWGTRLAIKQVRWDKNATER